ncbi:hypothetical protein AAY72_01560 [Alishewanella sp. WH16-1]|uniref:DUF1441 family protein n=1 Tax=Alishewanella sp. WH16-1 TaxID=1651088 RepID=UPI00070DE39E|nr:DUF1441 family protein [Alishewanella sp. WH16-1]KRS22826.1 hypothetical protein AAY72_01560 [Alishewanella sp. WH16-1]
MGTLHNIDDAYAWSISRIAEAFNLDRRTVSARLKDSRVEPAGIRKGHPTYLLKDIGPVLFGETRTAVPGDLLDPAQMPPKDRKDWYQSERERLKLETELKELVPATEVARGYADLVKAVVNPLDSLIDELESKVGLSGNALDRVQLIIDNIREQMYLNAVKGGADPELADEDE